MLSIEFEDATFERESIRADYDLEIGVIATLSLRAAGKLVYREVAFPIVELRMALARWLAGGKAVEDDFEFVSMESDEVGLVWFRRQASGAWRMGSVHQDDPAFQEFPWDQVVDAVRRYVGAVDEWVEANLGVRVTEIIGL